MALKYIFSVVLSVSVFCTHESNSVQALTVKGTSCQNHTCINGQECFLNETNCNNPPCPLAPSCRPSCDVIRCSSGSYCLNGKCVNSCNQVDCGPEEECVLANINCVTSPCPQIPTCKPIDKCAVVRCQQGYRCFNGMCMNGPTCDGFTCGPGKECFLKEIRCTQTPCLPVPTCRSTQTCETIDCNAGSVCVNGKCIPQNTCDDFPCDPGQECFLESEGCTSAFCKPPKPVCRASCANILCLAPSNCVDGQCVLITAIGEGKT